MARKLLSVAGVLLAVTAAWSWAAGGTSRVLEDREGWATLPSGLELGVFRVDPNPDVGDGRLVVLRIDPTRFELRLSLASETGRKRRAAGWLAEEAGVLAAVNATMFDVDHRTAVGLLVNGDHVNRAEPSRDNAVLAFDPVDPALPAARIVDRTCEDLDALRPRYRSLVQGIRMMGCAGENVWAPQPRRWSEAALGQDAEGRILFLFSRTPWTAHDFVERVRGLGIGVVRLQHADGGPPAQLAWREGDRVVGLGGSYESDVRENDLRVTPPEVPLLLGVVARVSPRPSPPR